MASNPHQRYDRNHIMLQLQSFFVVALLLCPALGQAPQPDPVDHCAEGHCHHFLYKTQNTTATPGNMYDLGYVSLTLQADPRQPLLTGAATLHLRTTQAAATLDFDLEGLTVDSVLYHGQRLAYTHTSPVLTVQLPTTLPQGTADSLTIYYQGEPSTGGLGSYVRESIEGQEIIWTLSQPYGARRWWPTKQTLTDKLDSVQLVLTHPAHYTAVSNGTLLARTLADTIATTTWRHRYPIPAYLVAFALADYQYFRDTVALAPGDTLNIDNWVLNRLLPWAPAEVARTKGLIPWYGAHFGRYPYVGEKYGHAEFGYGGGMEHTTVSFMGGFTLELIAHELAHQWFGDLVTCGSWQHLWLNEGWATYLQAMAFEWIDRQQLYSFMRQMQERVTRLPGGSVFAPDTTNLQRLFDSRLTYRKGACVLHLLRHQLGDSAFFAAARNYLADPALRWGYAHTADLQHHLELAADTTLADFFQQWVYGEGYPTYHVRWEAQGTTLSLQLQQTTSHPSVAFYSLRVPVHIEGQSRDTTLLLPHTYSGQQWSITLPWQPVRVTLDPDSWILKGPTDYWSPDFVHRVSPNPATDYLDLTWDSYYYLLERVTLTNTQGRRVLQQAPMSRSLHHRIHTDQLAAGVYHLEIQANSKTYRHKILICR